jgi:hypothetical protein
MATEQKRTGVACHRALGQQQRQGLVERWGLGCHAIAGILWEGDNRVEVGLVGRRALKFQFLNTRE